jgi:hypothetical protein
MFRDAKHGAALRHLLSGYPEVNRAWMWGALIAASLTGWLHQLTARTAPDGALIGHGVRDGQAMIATLRHRLIRIPARLVRHAGALTLRLPPGHHLLEEVLTHPRPRRHDLTRPPRPQQHRNHADPRRHSGRHAAHNVPNPSSPRSPHPSEDHPSAIRGFGSDRLWA